MLSTMALTLQRRSLLLHHNVRPLVSISTSSYPFSTSASTTKSSDRLRQPHLFLRSSALVSPIYSPWLITPLQTRAFSRRSGRDPWGSNHNSDWLDTVKTGALLALGAGAVITFASVGFGFIVFSAAGYGVYTLYRKFVAPYRARNDPFGSVQADIDRIFRENRASQTGGRRSADSDLESLLEGLPFVVRGVVKTLASVVGGAMQSSMARAGELRRLTNEHLQSNARIVSQLGHGVSISTPQNWSEYTVNGVGRVEAVFPVAGDGFARAQVNVKASIVSNGQLQLQELKYRDHRSGEVIDLLHDATSGRPRKTVVEAEYVDTDSRRQ